MFVEKTFVTMFQDKVKANVKVWTLAIAPLESNSRPAALYNLEVLADRQDADYQHYGRRAFSCAGPAAWNSLLERLKNSTLTIEQFRRLVIFF